MSPPPLFSWRSVVQGLAQPGPPPTALPGTAFILLALCLAAIVVLVQLGHAWHDDPHRFFGERKAGTYLSFFNLLATGGVAALIARRLRTTPFARFWWVAALGFVWLGCDDLFVIHERLDRGIHAVLGLDPEDPITDRVVADTLHLSKTLEDVLKVVAGTLILVGFLAAWLQLAVPGDQP